MAEVFPLKSIGTFVVSVASVALPSTSAERLPCVARWLDLNQSFCESCAHLERSISKLSLNTVTGGGSVVVVVLLVVVVVVVGSVVVVVVGVVVVVVVG